MKNKYNKDQLNNKDYKSNNNLEEIITKKNFINHLMYGNSHNIWIMIKINVFIICKSHFIIHILELYKEKKLLNKCHNGYSDPNQKNKRNSQILKLFLNSIIQIKLIKQEKNKENHKKVIKIKRIKGMIQYRLIYNQNKF